MTTPDNAQCNELLHDLDNVSFDDDIYIPSLLSADPELNLKYIESIKAWFNKNFSTS